MKSSNEYEISDDRSRLDIAFIHDFLKTSYWASGIPRTVVEKFIEHSLCFGAYKDGRQVGFARVITDYTTFGYLSDVFVIPEHRGHGVSKLMVQAIIQHPELQGFRRLLLTTKDAHGLYAQFGFRPIASPEMFMTIHNPDVYLQKGKNPG